MSNKALFGVFCLRMVIWCAAGALTEAERESLTILNATYPALQTVFPIDQFSEEGDLGGSWTKSWDDVCNNGAGWSTHGIYCSASGHIEGLQLYVSSCCIHQIASLNSHTMV